MYPTASKSDVIAYVNGRADRTQAPRDLKVAYRGSDATDFVEEIEWALDGVLASWHDRDEAKYSSDQSRDHLEGILAVELHRSFAGLPAGVLTDRDFWRFCAAYLYDFVMWRQPTSTVTAALPYFGAASNGIGRECVPHRMFDRALIALSGGQAAGALDPYELATFGASDVWKSHVLRVANGNAPLVVRAMLTDVRDGMLKTDVVRPFVKNLRRVRSNVLFEVLDELQARDLVTRERERTLSAAASLDSQQSPS